MVYSTTFTINIHKFNPNVVAKLGKLATYFKMVQNGGLPGTPQSIHPKGATIFHMIVDSSWFQTFFFLKERVLWGFFEA